MVDSVPSHELKLRRAREHVAEAHSRIVAWSAEGGIDSALHIRDGLCTHTLALDTAPPPVIALALGDGAQQMRAALDHVAFQIAQKASEGAMTDQQQHASAFPVQQIEPRHGFRWANAAKTKRNPQIECWPDAAGDVLERMQPWNSIDRDTHGLGMLDLTASYDKHRALSVLVAGVINVTVSNMRFTGPVEPISMGDVVLSFEPRPFLRHPATDGHTGAIDTQVRVSLGHGLVLPTNGVFATFERIEHDIRAYVLALLKPWL